METSGFMAEAARRLTSWGTTIVAVLGVVLAINAAYSDQYTGAGVCLAASALAIGALSHTFIQRYSRLTVPAASSAPACH